MAKITLEQLREADRLGGELVKKLPKIDALSLADTIATLTASHLEELQEQTPKTEEELRGMAVQACWWNVLLISKLRQVVTEQETSQKQLILPPAEAN